MSQSFLSAVMENTFLQYSLIAVFLTSLIAGIIGSLLVSNNIVFIGGGVAHCAYGGIGMAVFFGFSTLLGASLSALFVAFCLAVVRRFYSHSVDVFNTILWALGMSLGVLFLNLAPQSGVDIESYLFGSIISVEAELLWILLGFDVLLVGFVTLYYREILGVSYDYECCRLRSIRAPVFMNLIFAYIALGIILSMQVSGLILVLAILSIPAYVSNMFVRTLRGQMALSTVLSLVFMLAGLWVAYHYNVSPGASITLVALTSMALAYGLHRIYQRRGHGRA